MLKSLTHWGAISLIFCAVLFISCFGDNFNTVIEEENISSQKPDTLDPVPGNQGTILVSNVQSTALKLDWRKSTDDRTLQEDLQYTVFKSDRNNINTFEDAQQNGTPVIPGWTVDIDSVDILGLESGVTYFFNVFVRDAENKISPYNARLAVTGGDVIILFSGGSHNGDLAGRAGADELCRATRERDYPQLPGSCVRAFISIDLYDSIAGMPRNYLVPPVWPIQGLFGTRIADSWSDLLDGSIAVSLSDAGIVQSPWWSGSTCFGDSTGTGPCNNCMGWTIGDTSDEGFPGSHNYTDERWMDEGGEFSCNEELAVLCVNWDGDCLPPVPGGSGELHTSLITNDSIKIHWEEAEDESTSQSLLQYQVYYALNPSITTYVEALYNGIESTAGWTSDIGKWTVDGLNEVTTYYFAVFVKDESGSITPYNVLAALTD